MTKLTEDKVNQLTIDRLTNRGTGIYPPLIQKEQSIDEQISNWEVQEALNGRR